MSNRKIFKGTFSFDADGKLDFNCTTQNISFDEVKAGLIKLIDELQRQINNEAKCPYHSIDKPA